MVQQKTEIEAVIAQYTPDIFLISEANMSMNLSDTEKEIGGYSMVLPRTVEERQLVRLVMLVKEGVRVEEMKNLMDSETASIWVKVGPQGRKPLLIGGIYREHQFLEQGEDNSSETDLAQESRWNKFVNKWEQAGRNSDVMVLGDVNLDHLTWAQPKQRHKTMVDKVKDQIETAGYHQLIQGVTRTWPGQPDTCLDQCWTNVPGRVIYHRNIVRSASDHNMILVSIRTKNRVEDKHEIVKRERRNMDVEKYKENMRNIDWTSLYNCQDLELMNSLFEEQVLAVLEEAAPLKVYQVRKGVSNWLNMEVKGMMDKRDHLREEARKCRNKCLKMLNKCKTDYYRELF